MKQDKRLPADKNAAGLLFSSKSSPSIMRALTGDRVQLYNGSCTKTCAIVVMTSWLLRNTLMVNSHAFRKTPSTEETPKALTRSRVNLKGTVSGTLSSLPCSNAIPRSMCTISADIVLKRILDVCLSPSPTMYPIMLLVATLRVKQIRFSNHTSASLNVSRKKK